MKKIFEDIHAVLDWVIDTEESDYRKYYCPDEGFDDEKLEGDHPYLDAHNASYQLQKLKHYLFDIGEFKDIPEYSKDTLDKPLPLDDDSPF